MFLCVMYPPLKPDKCEGLETSQIYFLPYGCGINIFKILIADHFNEPIQFQEGDYLSLSNTLVGHWTSHIGERKMAENEEDDNSNFSFFDFTSVLGCFQQKCTCHGGCHQQRSGSRKHRPLSLSSALYT